jgi:ABC-2 type transport system permease protein
MSTATTLDLAARRRLAGSTRLRVSPTHVLNSEWIKFRTLRSSLHTLIGAVLAMVVIGLAVGYSTSTSDWATLAPQDTVASASLQGLFMAQLVIGVLGVLIVTGEYATGMIRSTFAAVPHRLSVLGAKTAVFGAVALISMTAASFAAFLGAQALFLSPDGHGTSLSDPGVLRAVAGTGVYLTLVGVLGVALGWIVRSTAGAISTLVGILTVLPVIVGLLPGSISSDLLPYLPSNAGQAFGSSIRTDDMLAPWSGLGVFVLWVVAALIAAAVLVRRRDA